MTTPSQKVTSKERSMTKKQFDNYRFSVNTEVSVRKDIWEKLTDVDFEERWVGTYLGNCWRYTQIKHIREAL